MKYWQRNLLKARSPEGVKNYLVSVQKRTRPSQIRFWEKVQKTNGCWLWKACKNNRGYGVFVAEKRRRIYAHRFSYEISFGKIPNKMCVCHKCDVPDCVNPDHLFLGTVDDNNKDAAKKGRMKKKKPGWVPLRPTAKLSWEQVRAIREINPPSGKYTEVGKLFGVKYNAVRDIVLNIKWKE